MSSSSSWGQSPAIAAGGAAAEAAAAAATGAAQPVAAQEPVPPAVCADVGRRMQHADNFWQQLEAAAAAEVGPQKAKR